MSIRRKLASVALTGAIGVAMVVGGSGAAHAATGTTGPHTTPQVACYQPGGTGTIGGVTGNITMYPPTIKAVNKTTARDVQTVAFQPVAWKWNGTAWVEYSGGKIVYGTASDVASPTAWYDIATGKPVLSGATAFKMARGGYYKVAFKMWWYSTPTTIQGSDYLWASGYSLQSPIGGPLPAISYCST